MVLRDKKNTVVRVWVALPFNREFLYQSHTTNHIEDGQIVKIPFGKRTALGIIVGREELQLCNIDFSVREILQTFDIPVINCKILKFIQWAADYNFIKIGTIVKMLLLNEKNLTHQKVPKKNKKQSTEDVTKLSTAQKNIVDAIIKSGLQTFQPHLILGSTGSGKTEIYLDIALQVLMAKRQVLILLPEILLTTHLIHRFSAKLGEYQIAQWHSSLTPNKRSIIWHGVLNGTTNVIVGARSSLFLPFKKLGLIIVDEEHDNSFKQDEGTIYNARDMSIVYAKIGRFPIILSSATPSAESFCNATKGKYQLHQLSKRYTGVHFPDVQIINMTKKEKQYEKCISFSLQEELKRCVAERKMAMIFLNRRGYTAITLCGDCGHKFSCPACDIALVKHKSFNEMICHHCHYKQLSVTNCPKCKSNQKLLSYGYGIEKIAEEVRILCPNAKIAVLSSDTISSIKKAAKVLEEITNGTYDIILGTQIIAKGFNFPGLHLVGVIDAEGSNIGFDVRATEKIFQLLYQVAGRAGRENSRGLVLLQTFDPASNLLANVSNWDYKSFIEEELNNRRIAAMPPFTKLILLRTKGYNKNLLNSFNRALVNKAPTQDGLILYGPAPAALYKLRNKYRWHILLKISKSFAIKEYLSSWLASIKKPSSIDLKIDVDPYNFY
jgi:primosomal protein N' (replication factor Y)